jgi:hypothetical protein
MSSHIMRVIPKLWCWATTVVAGLFIVEFALRAAVPGLDPALQFHMIDGTGSVPTLAPHNSLLRQRSIWGEFDVSLSIGPNGLRETKDILAAPDNAIFVVGNQFAFGEGVAEDQRFSAGMQTALGTPVYNIAMRALLPTGQFKLVHFVEQNIRNARGSNYQIRRLLVVISVPRDIRRYEEMAKEAPHHSPIVSASSFRNSFFSAPVNWLLRNTALGLCGRIALYKYALSRDFGLLSKVGVYDALRSWWRGSRNRRMPAEGLVDSEAVRQTVGQLKKIAKLRNSLFLIMPPTTAFHGDGPRGESMLYDALISELARAGIAYVDTRPMLTEAAKSESVVFRHAEQWNVAAHAALVPALAAAATSRWAIAKD